jgi:hypothetical protein
LQERLAAERDPATFAHVAVRLAAERGFVFDTDAVAGAVRAGRQAWLERRLE